MNENLARTLEEHVIRTVRYADEGLRVLGKEFLCQGVNIDIPALQRQGILASPLFIRASIIGPDDYLVVSSSPPKTTYLGDREVIRIHLGHDSGELRIGEPTIGRANGKWSVYLTRRINGPDGLLAGVASLAIDPSCFTGFFSSIHLGGNGFIEILGRDGIVRARYWESAQASEMGGPERKRDLLTTCQ